MVTGITENDFGDELKVYPNPTEGKVIVDFGNQVFSGTISGTNVLGKVVFHKVFHNQSRVNISIDNKSGIYFLQIIDENNKAATLKIMKK